MIHDFASVGETEAIKNLAKGKMKSTPYIITGKAQGFSKARTSKVMYMNERLVPEAEVMSIKAEQITKLNLYNEQFASENYQIMNYGIFQSYNSDDVLLLALNNSFYYLPGGTRGGRFGFFSTKLGLRITNRPPYRCSIWLLNPQYSPFEAS